MMERAGKKNGNNTDWQFWQQHNKPIEIKDQTIFDNTLEFMHQNPVIACSLQLNAVLLLLCQPDFLQSLLKYFHSSIDKPNQVFWC